MRRTVPLLITALGGLVLVVAYFSPHTQSWGKWAAIWFDILAAIAFVLGGGSLLKVHLKKISDRAAGWGYSGITLLAFLATLYIGLTKWGVPPAPKQERFGETFAALPLEEFPLFYAVEGEIPTRPDGKKLPPSARWQIDEETDEKDGKIRFHGWMSSYQQEELIDYREQLRWQCAVEKLFKKAQPPGKLKDKVQYLVDHEVLSFQGHMTDEDREQLRKLGESEEGVSDAWNAAVDELYKKTQAYSQVTVDFVPQRFDAVRAEKIGKSIAYDEKEKVLKIQGPMSADQRDALARQFPVARPLSPQRRGALLKELTDRGPLIEKQIKAFHALLDTTWKVEMLRKALDLAGEAEETDRSCCAMLEDQQAGMAVIELKETLEEGRSLSDEQVELLGEFVENEHWTVDALAARLAETPFNGKQDKALRAFFKKQPTAGQRKYELWRTLLGAGRLTETQQDYLLEDARNQAGWKAKIEDLFFAAHTVKFPWSGEYNAEGEPFWWLYEYNFKPLTATMFAMLAFYVASAAFRAFRAKNIEAILLLGTAFIILLGRTVAGIVATSWLPDWLSELRLENLTVTIMSIPNTAGTRAIFIGIALGIASTSLKVILGIERSYLGSGEK